MLPMQLNLNNFTYQYEKNTVLKIEIPKRNV